MRLLVIIMALSAAVAQIGSADGDSAIIIRIPAVTSAPEGLYDASITPTSSRLGQYAIQEGKLPFPFNLPPVDDKLTAESVHVRETAGDQVKSIWSFGGLVRDSQPNYLNREERVLQNASTGNLRGSDIVVVSPPACHDNDMTSVVDTKEIDAVIGSVDMLKSETSSKDGKISQQVPLTQSNLNGATMQMVTSTDSPKTGATVQQMPIINSSMLQRSGGLVYMPRQGSDNIANHVLNSSSNTTVNSSMLLMTEGPMHFPRNEKKDMTNQGENKYSNLVVNSSTIPRAGVLMYLSRNGSENTPNHVVNRTSEMSVNSSMLLLTEGLKESSRNGSANTKEQVDNKFSNISVNSTTIERAGGPLYLSRSGEEDVKNRSSEMAVNSSILLKSEGPMQLSRNDVDMKNRVANSSSEMAINSSMLLTTKGPMQFSGNDVQDTKSHLANSSSEMAVNSSMLLKTERPMQLSRNDTDMKNRVANSSSEMAVNSSLLLKTERPMQLSRNDTDMKNRVANSSSEMAVNSSLLLKTERPMQLSRNDTDMKNRVANSSSEMAVNSSLLLKTERPMQLSRNDTDMKNRVTNSSSEEAVNSSLLLTTKGPMQLSRNASGGIPKQVYINSTTANSSAMPHETHLHRNETQSESSSAETTQLNGNITYAVSNGMKGTAILPKPDLLSNEDIGISGNGTTAMSINGPAAISVQQVLQDGRNNNTAEIKTWQIVKLNSSTSSNHTETIAGNKGKPGSSSKLAHGQGTRTSNGIQIHRKNHKQKPIQVSPHVSGERVNPKKKAVSVGISTVTNGSLTTSESVAPVSASANLDAILEEMKAERAHTEANRKGHGIRDTNATSDQALADSIMKILHEHHVNSGAQGTFHASGERVTPVKADETLRNATATMMSIGKSNVSVVDAFGKEAIVKNSHVESDIGGHEMFNETATEVGILMGAFGNVLHAHHGSAGHVNDSQQSEVGFSGQYQGNTTQREFAAEDATAVEKINNSFNDSARILAERERKAEIDAYRITTISARDLKTNQEVTLAPELAPENPLFRSIYLNSISANDVRGSELFQRIPNERYTGNQQLTPNLFIGDDKNTPPGPNGQLFEFAQEPAVGNVQGGQRFSNRQSVSPAMRNDQAMLQQILAPMVISPEDGQTPRSRMAFYEAR